MKECKYITHMTDKDLQNLIRLLAEGKTATCYPSSCIRGVLKQRYKQSERRKMGTWEKNLIFLVIRYLLRWLSSNDKNHKEPLIDQAFSKMGFGKLDRKNHKGSERKDGR